MSVVDYSQIICSITKFGREWRLEIVPSGRVALCLPEADHECIDWVDWRISVEARGRVNLLVRMLRCVGVVNAPPALDQIDGTLYGIKVNFVDGEQQTYKFLSPFERGPQALPGFVVSELLRLTRFEINRKRLLPALVLKLKCRQAGPNQEL